MGELNLDQAPQDYNKEYIRVRLQAFVDATDPGWEKELIRSGSLGLLKNIIEPKLEDGLPNIVLMLRILLASTISRDDLVVMVMNLWPACHSSCPCATKDPPSRWTDALESIQAQSPPVWSFKDGNAYKSRPRHLTMAQNYEDCHQ
ncbi:hypothetical protein TNCV_1514231 [Trichonephila clavipes]|nr:hypothetical protein TNCV_1514231 [Trichonephila clavipes]